MQHWSEHLKTWSFRYPNGTKKATIEESIMRLLRRQHGTQVTISKVSNFLKSDLHIKPKHQDLYYLMIEMGAKLVNGAARNRYIFDITECIKGHGSYEEREKAISAT